MSSSLLLTTVLSFFAAILLHWALFSRREIANWRTFQDQDADDGWSGALKSAMEDIETMPVVEHPDPQNSSAAIDPAGIPPVHHIVPPDVCDFVIPNFRRGLDSCQVALSFPEIEFVYRRVDSGVVLVFDDGDEQLTVSFLGLQSPPFSDVSVVFEHPEKGRSVETLQELLGGETAEELGHEFPNRLSEAFVSPLTGDDGVNGDTMRVAPPAEFQSFDPDREYVEIWISGSILQSEVQVRPSPDGRDGLVVVDGHLSAVLRGAPGSTVRNVRLVPTHSGANA